LEIGSDSRAGLTGKVAIATGASSTPGQRSDVVKIMHIDPEAGTISVLSIPRDTMVTLLANTSLYGNFNRINVNFDNGPSLPRSDHRGQLRHSHSARHRGQFRRSHEFD